MKNAAIFDWDGTLADTINSHLESWKLLASKHGFSLPDGFIKDTFGKRNVEIIRDVVKWVPDTASAENLSDQKEIFYREIISQNGLPLVRGARRFLEGLKKSGILSAIASSTPRKNMEVSLAALGMEDLFEACVCSEDVSRGKPAPDPFILAAQKLGIPPCDCAVFEDSIAGVQGANAANMPCVIIATTYDEKFWNSFMAKNPSGKPRVVIKNFDGFSEDDFAKLFL